MRIDGRKRHLMLDAQSRDPEVVLWNGLALLPQSEAQLGVDLGGGDRDVQNGAASDERFNLGEVLGRLPRIEGTVAQLADNGRRQKVLVDARKQPGVDLRGQDIDRDTRVERDSITTPWVDALELTIDDLPELLSVLRSKRAGNLRERRRLHLDVHGQRDLVVLGKALGTAERPEYAVLEYGGYGLAHVHNPSRSRMAS